ncbi:MAG: hypothetical protein IJR79_02735 [Clostridia bacterium]|nr:hypothetical protein [Clostridia bacterium]
MIKSLIDLKWHLNSLVGHITFDYNGHSCGIDPISKERFEMWYGDDCVTIKSIDEAFSKPFFNGLALNDIWDDVTNIDY